MAPAVGFAHAATALSLLALGLNVETRFRAGGLLTAPPAPEPQPEPLAHHLQGEMEQLQGTVSELGIRTARIEALFEPRRRR